MWHRVFCLDPAGFPASRIAGELHARGFPVEPHFRGDATGWTGGHLVLPGGGTAVSLDRYLTAEDDLRGELNTFAALLETMDFSPHAPDLMRRVIQTQQLVAIRRPIDHADEFRLDGMLEALCRLLATERDGIYQIDGAGWYAANGELLLHEY